MYQNAHMNEKVSFYAFILKYWKYRGTLLYQLWLMKYISKQINTLQEKQVFFFKKKLPTYRP